MPQKRPARSKGYDPTISIATASAAKTLNTITDSQTLPNDEPPKDQKANDDLKKLIETLKSKIGTNQNPVQKKVPPPQNAKAAWNRSASNTKWTPRPAYTILTRVSNHEKVPLKSTKSQERKIDDLPHSFLYKPGVDGITIENVKVIAARQIVRG